MPTIKLSRFEPDLAPAAAGGCAATGGRCTAAGGNDGFAAERES